MSKVIAILLCLFVTFWSIPQINNVLAEVSKCPVNPIIEFNKDGTLYQLREGTPVPQGASSLYFTFHNTDNFLREGIPYRLFIQWEEPLSLFVPGAPSSEALLKDGLLTLDTSNPDLLKATPANARYKVTLQQQDSQGRYPSNNDTGVCTGLTYKVGSSSTTKTCEITLSNESPGLGENVTAIVSKSSDGEFKVYTNFKDPDHPNKQSIQITNGGGKFTFKTPDTTSLDKAEVGLYYEAGENINFFCIHKFSIKPIPSTNKVSCLIKPPNPSIFDNVSVEASNLQPGEIYWTRLINKNTGEIIDKPNETAAELNKTASLPLNTPDELPEGTYNVEVYKKGDEQVQCITNDFKIQGSVVAAPVKKHCVIKAENDKTPLKDDEKLCSISAGNSCKTGRGPAIVTAIGCIHTNPAEFTKDLMKFVIGISGGLAFLMMLLGAFQILSSGDNPDTLKAGRERLTSAVIGLLIVIFAILLLQIIGVGILAIPGFGP